MSGIFAAIAPEKSKAEVDAPWQTSAVETFPRLREEVWSYRFKEGVTRVFGAEVHFRADGGVTYVTTYEDTCVRGRPPVTRHPGKAGRASSRAGAALPPAVSAHSMRMLLSFTTLPQRSICETTNFCVSSGLLAAMSMPRVSDSCFLTSAG